MIKKIIWLAVFAAAVVCRPVLAQDTANSTNELKEANALLAQIAADVHSGKTTEAALSGDFKRIDSLLAEHKSEKDEIMAEVLYEKVDIYIEVIGDDDKADAVIRQLTNDYSDTPIAVEIEKAIARQAEEAKMQASLVPGVQFPDFTEKDIKGSPMSIASHKGKVVLVDFWATWCVPCRLELPYVLEAYQEYHDKGFEVIGVSLDKDPQAMLDFIQQNDMPWQEYCDGHMWANKLAQKYGVTIIPATYLLDGNGKIIAKNLRVDKLSDAVAKALAGK